MDWLIDSLPDGMEVILSGTTGPEKLAMLDSFPLTLRVRGEDNKIQIDGFSLGKLNK